MTGALSVGGLGLVGMGTHATFMQDTVSQQSITSGTLDVTLSGSGVLSNNNQTLTLPAIGNPTPVGSTFTTGPTLITMTNVGTLPAAEITQTIAVSGGSGLAAQAYACETSFAGPNQTLPIVIYNGLLSGLVGTMSINGSIPVSGTDGYSLEIFAGSVTTACGTATVGHPPVSGLSGAPSLTNTAEGQTITVSNTVHYTA